jgi:hypothetical protein
LKSPYPYFGGKRKIAEMVWKRFGVVQNYVEPFFGSGAMLLGKPEFDCTETVNDADGMVSNFWRALKSDQKGVANAADWPVNENDLHARHAWLVGQKDSLQSRLEGDPDYCDAKIAGWWVWGMACWIGGEFCSGKGPWHVVDGKLVRTENNGEGTERRRVHVANQGQGVRRRLVHVGDQGQGVNRKRERLIGFSETGVNACQDLQSYFAQLCERMRKVRVCCGDWSRVCGPSVTFKHGLTAVFLDPPYADTANRDSNIYRVDSESVAHSVREWAIAEGKNPLMRIALCGYEGEHQMPGTWECCSWNAGAGFGGQAKEGVNGNGKKERVWFSPHCERDVQGNLI